MHNRLVSDPRFLSAVEAIYDAGPDPSLWPAALEAIADVFDDVGAVLSYSGDDGRFGAIGSPRLEGLLHEYMTAFEGDDLRSSRGVERGMHLLKDAVTDGDIVTDDEMETHPFYRLLARHRLKYFAGVAISPDPRVAAFVAVQRAIGKRPYEDDEMAAMTILGRHAEKSLRLSIRLFNAEQITAGLAETLMRVGIGIFVLDALGRVLFRNPAAERAIGHGLRVVDGMLGVGSCPDRTHIEEALSEALSEGARHQIGNPRPLLIERQPPAEALTVYVLPIARSGKLGFEMLTHARAIVLVIERGANELPDPAQVRDLLGVTLGEARVAALVGSGFAPRETAQKLGLSEATVRTTLKRIFSKVGVSRQSELATLLARRVLR